MTLAREIKRVLRRSFPATSRGAFPTAPLNVTPRAAPLKFKILRTRWKDAGGAVVEGVRLSATRLNADELEQLAREILRAAADCRTAASRGCRR
jgi:hypothetical protein